MPSSELVVYTNASSRVRSACAPSGRIYLQTTICDRASLAFGTHISVRFGIF